MPGHGSRRRRSELDGLPSPGLVDRLRSEPQWTDYLSGVPDKMGGLPVFVERGNVWVPVAYEWEVNPAGNSDIEWMNGIAYRPMYQIVMTPGRLAEIINPMAEIRQRIGRG